MVDEPKKKIDWKQAFEIFTRVSTWVIVPIVLALIAGEALDERYGTKPWIFLGLTIVSFIVSSYGIVRVITKYMKEINAGMTCEPKVADLNQKPEEQRETEQDTWQ